MLFLFLHKKSMLGLTSRYVVPDRMLVVFAVDRLIWGVLRHIEGWAQDYGNSNIFLKPLFRGNLDPFVNNANLGAIAHTSNGT